MDFSSDTSAPAHPSVLEAVLSANSGMAASYGGDALTAQLRGRLAEIFETDLAILPVISGTAANALGLSLLCRPDEAIACHEEAHIERDERGAPEFYTGGGKLHLMRGEHGRIQPDDLSALCKTINRSFVHETPVAALSLTNLTECGATYTASEIGELAGIAREAGLHVHLDGARFANAMVSTDASPAEMSWKAGVDILSLGLTKGGAIGCEIICLFGDMAARHMELLARAKRGGHLPPKMWFMSAQGLSMLKDDLWLTLARHANEAASKLAEALTSVSGVRLAHPVDGNEVFAHLPEQLQKRLFDAGLKAYPWVDSSVRFVCHWNTSENDIKAVVEHCN